MTISKDRLKPSPQPDSWKLREIFSTGVVLGGYQALMTVVFFWVMKDSDFFSVYTLILNCCSRPVQKAKLFWGYVELFWCETTGPTS